jgi:hypothetical protein
MSGWAIFGIVVGALSSLYLSYNVRGIARYLKIRSM